MSIAARPMEAAASAEIATRFPQPLGKRCAFPTAPTGPTATMTDLFNRPPNRGKASLLSQLGIPFKTSESEQADLVELCAVRNCLVHLAGRVDDRIEKAIPKLGINSGETIELTEDLWKRWHATAGKFQEALMNSSARSDYANWWDPVLGEIIPGPGLDDALKRRERALREGVKT